MKKFKRKENKWKEEEDLGQSDKQILKMSLISMEKLKLNYFIFEVRVE